jgi:hypothetical protein
MMSQLAVTPIDTERLVKHGHAVATAARRSGGRAPWADDAETDSFVDYWFGQSQKHQLQALVTAIDDITDETQKLGLRIALSRTIVTKSPRASLAADAAHSRPHRVITHSEYNTVDGFQASTVQLGKLLDRRELHGRGRAALGDARALTCIRTGAADMVVTSPPYLNALDYLRGHKLALVWFGYTISDLRQRRAISIGSERGIREDVPPIVTKIVEAIEFEAVNPDAINLRMLKRYAIDCVQFATELFRSIRPGGTAVLVVGNSTLRGNFIDNSRTVQLAMENAGFVMIRRREREIPPLHRYMAINTKDHASRAAKRMRSEVVLTFRRRDG